MNYLFIHQNFPGQYKNIVRHLVARGDRVVFLSQANDNRMAGVRLIAYRPGRPITPGIHHYIRDFEAAILNGQAVLRVCSALKAKGFRPDIVIGHAGWGELSFVKDVWPDVPVLGYFEYYYRLAASDVGFDPAFPATVDDGPRLRAKNATTALALEAVDWGQTPTRWQWSRFPDHARRRISVLHEGIDTNLVRPNPDAVFMLPEAGLGIRAGAPIVTYVARGLEPYRGFPSFMRALPAVLRRRPDAHVLIAGSDEIFYGRRHPSGRGYAQVMLDELGDRIDRNRVHFLGRIPYERYLSLLAVSAVHVYLTYPFVLSWSMLEAMSAGCLVVGSATSPVEEVITEGETGLLADFHDPAQLAERILEGLADSRRTPALRQAARALVCERFDFQSMILPRYEALLAALIKGETPAEKGDCPPLE